jgi:hypothetical protein
MKSVVHDVDNWQCHVCVDVHDGDGVMSLKEMQSECSAHLAAQSASER